MLIIDQNSVYEIDEECMKKRKVPSTCELPEKIMELENTKKMNRIKERNQKMNQDDRKGSMKKKEMH